MKRNSFLLACILISLGLSAFGYEGPMSGQRKLRIVKTQYFDIIYSPDSADSAKILQEKGDALFDEVAEKFELKHYFRLPVIITPASDDFNGYFSLFPFSHIVMYDSLPYDSNLVHSETFISTFRHELIHAVSYNSRSKGLYNFDRIFGDVYNPALITITTFFAEGATVSLESDNGEGRMNSEYAKQILKQAKIEGCFPDYADVQGARDIYPSANASYIFGGAFCKWLQEKYGMEKYAEFWQTCVSLKKLTYFSCFKKVYGITMKKAWQDFYDSIEIPKDVKIEKPRSRDISYYGSLTSSDAGIAYYDLYKTGVYFKKNEKKRAGLLLTQTGLKKVNLSKDGAFLAVTHSDEAYVSEKSRIYVYDMKHKISFALPETGLRDGAMIMRDGKYYVAGVKINSGYSTLKIYRLLRNKNNVIAKAKLVAEQPLEYGSQHFSLEGDAEGNLYYIYKKALDFSICRFSLETRQTSRFALPEGKVEVQKLNYSDGKIYFSYTFQGCLPRLGILERNDYGWNFNLSSDELSGGVYSPVCDGERIDYIANYFKGYALKSVQKSELNFDEYEASEEVFDALVPPEEVVRTKPEDVEGSKKFNPFTYTFTGPRGAILPFSLSSSYAIDSSADSLVKDTNTAAMLALPLGLTYMSSLPWTSPIYYFSAGYGVFTNSFGLTAGIIRGKTDSDLVSYSGAAHFEFDQNGFKQTYETFRLSVKLPLFRTFYAAFSDKIDFFEGRQSKTEYHSSDVNSMIDYVGILSKEKKNEDLSIRRIFAENEASVSFGNIHRAGKGYSNYAGFRLGATLDCFYCLPEDDWDKEYYHFENVSPNLMIRIPGYVPLAVEGALFPTDCYFGYITGQAVLFSWEIQEAAPVLPIIYLNRLSFTAQYTAKFKQRYYMESWPLSRLYGYVEDFKDGLTDYYDQLTLLANIYFTPNLGGLARQDFQLKASMGYIYRFSPEPDENSGEFAFSIGFENLLLF